jgi:hypothetical protein
MTCPVCRSYVPVHSYLEATGLSGVVCPHCNSSLRPSWFSNYVLLMLSYLPSQLFVYYMRTLHANFFITMAVFTVLLAGLFSLLAPWVIRLEPKESSILRLNHR